MEKNVKKILVVISFFVVIITIIYLIYFIKDNHNLNASKYLIKNATNSKNMLYSDNGADKGKMFVFTQTINGKEITEYRYIGDEPNNYVEFNCDDDGKNCEIWRIIGIFDVETPNIERTKTKVEKRIKLVRNSVLPNHMVWDKKGNDLRIYNNWAPSSLKGFLNNEYYNSLDKAAEYGLKKSANSMIDEVFYNLGGIEISGDIISTEALYNFERGTKVYPKHPTEWISKIGLMYPSDQYMVYAKGVNDDCYNTPYDTLACNSTNASKGWIYNTNKIDEQSNNENIWFMTSYATDETNVTLSYVEGNIINENCSSKAFVRPVLYLSSKVKIIEGDGTKNNPYKLSL